MTKMHNGVEVGGGSEKCNEGEGGMCVETKLEPEGFDCYCKHTVGGMYCDMEQVRLPLFCIFFDKSNLGNQYWQYIYSAHWI